MYSLEDTKKLYNCAKIEQSVKEEFPELIDINEHLCAILYRTAFFSSSIDEKTSYNSVNYIVELLKSLDKEELNKVDHHLIDSFTYPYNLYNDKLINGMNAIFRPESFDDELKYIESFTNVFNKVTAVHAAGIEVSKYRNIDMLVKSYSTFLANDLSKVDHIAIIELILPYLYLHIDEFNIDQITKIYEVIYSDSYYLDKIRLNSNIPLNELIENTIDLVPYKYSKEQFLNAYKIVIHIVNSIINNENINEERVIR